MATVGTALAPSLLQPALPASNISNTIGSQQIANNFAALLQAKLKANNLSLPIAARTPTSTSGTANLSPTLSQNQLMSITIMNSSMNGTNNAAKTSDKKKPHGKTHSRK
ncbi:hypothetical protein [Kordiimonas sp. SCSIO 12610]|uniref:hypothetical protein n=1 Tax=Kordiimonas sp. SCSIO 12610 TaxID=2829597 RepID=UPI00210DA8B6|nr:hypothetical protein [Kordiimonas sp. SCSIO 12610]UTW54188.1 hypothetical protein KFF44_10140 [Kordiimonas sp. SCSIO 12610]